MAAKPSFDFDGALKELWERDRPSLLHALTGGVPIRETLNVELPRVQARRADIVYLLDDGSILHIEFQSTNDRDIAYRQGIYCLLLAQRHRKPVRQVVLYVGRGKMTMPDSIETGQTTVHYQILDIRSIAAEQLVATGHPADLALSILGGGGHRILTRIIAAATRLDGPARNRVLAQLLVLSGLRGLSTKVEWEMKHMGVVIDARKNPVLMRYFQEVAEEIKAEAFAEGRELGVELGVERGREQGREQGREGGTLAGKAQLLEGLLTERFGSLPKWATERLHRATADQLDRWGRKFVTAATLENVIGRR